MDSYSFSFISDLEIILQKEKKRKDISWYYKSAWYNFGAAHVPFPQCWSGLRLFAQDRSESENVTSLPRHMYHHTHTVGYHILILYDIQMYLRFVWFN